MTKCCSKKMKLENLRLELSKLDDNFSLFERNYRLSKNKDDSVYLSNLEVYRQQRKVLSSQINSIEQNLRISN